MAIDISQSYSKELMIWLGAIFLVVPTCFTALRLTAKRLGPKRFMIDDYLAVTAWALNVACRTCLLIAAVDGQLGQHQRVDSDNQPILNDPHFLVYEKTKWAVNMLSILGLGSVKLSILVFYLQIFSVRSFKIKAYFIMALILVWAISFFFTNLLTCLPPTALVEPFYGKKCLDSISMWMASTVSDVVLDFAILLIPIPNVLSLQMRWSQKLMVIGIFCLGGCICGISIVRLLVWFQIAQQFAIHYNDETYFTSPVFFWVVIELGLACVCAALPTMRPIWLFLSTKMSSSNYSSNTGAPPLPQTFEMARYINETSLRSHTVMEESGIESRSIVKLQDRENMAHPYSEFGSDKEHSTDDRICEENFSSHTDAQLLTTTGIQRDTVAI